MSQPPPVPESLLSATIEHLQRDAPFDRMEQEPLTYLVSHLRLGYYPKDAIILTPAHGVAQSFYVIKQGTVVGEQVDEGRADEGRPGKPRGNGAGRAGDRGRGHHEA